MKIPKGKFGVILADPPWRFRTWNDENDAKSARRHYSILTLDEIKAFPVRNSAADDAALFLWCTWPTMPQSFEVIKAWGFRFSGLAWEWIKYNPETGKYAFGTGYGTRKNLEPCLLGAPRLLNRSVRDFILAPRREHSRKPDEQYERIEAMYAGPRLELFARNKRRGWKVAGNETEKFK